MPREKFYKLFFVFLSFFICIIAAEILLNFLIPSEKFCLWPPYRKVIFKPYPGIMTGVSNNALFKINADGVRGDDLILQKLKILAIGGSTTECLYIDQPKTWPYILQKNLNQARKEDVWVGNIGRSGLSTTGNLIELKYLLPQYSKKIDLIVALVGFNDLQSMLLNTFKINSLKSDPEKVDMVFAIHPAKADGILEKSALFRYTKKAINYYFNKNKEFVEDSVGSWYIGARNARKRATRMLDELPDLSESLELYENNIKEIIKLARANGIRIIFLTQPYLWKDNLSGEEISLLWFGYTADKQKYYSIKALVKGMDQFNLRLKEVCRKEGIECIDLDRILPKDISIFYDDVHFNENGCAKVANIISGYLEIKNPAQLKN